MAENKTKEEADRRARATARRLLAMPPETRAEQKKRIPTRSRRTPKPRYPAKGDRSLP